MKTKTSSKYSLKQSAIPTLVVDKDIQIWECSDALSHFFEQPTEFTFNDLCDIFGEVSIEFKHKLGKKKYFTETVQLISKTGQERWIKVNAYPIFDKEGFFQLSFDDVTEERIQYSLGQKAKELAKVGSWSVDLINNTIFWSDMTKKIHGVPLDFVPDLEKGIDFYKEGDDRARIIEAVSECIESGKSFDVELIIITATGKEKWIRSIGAAERVNGKTVGFKGVFQDIDEKKRSRLEYETISNRLRVGIESANVGVWDYDIVNNELFWDDKMYDLYGVDKNDFNGVYEAWERSVHPDDKELAATEVELAIQGKKEFNTEFRVIKNDGSIEYIHAEAKVFNDKNGVAYRLIGANTNVTRMKRKDERLRQLLNITEKQNQRLLEFTKIVSHNLRSNSSNISMLSGMLNQDLPIEDQKKFIQMIQTSSEQLDEIIVQLNEIAKIQATDKSEIIEIPIRATINKVLESLNGLILESDAKIKIAIDEKLRVKGIKPYLTSVFINLLTNSLKYRDLDKRLELEINSKVLKNQTVISFKDNGIGIDLKKHRSKLFGMYKTFHNHKDSKGIGLFITKNHMEAMDGKIEAESTVGKGTTFNLYFKN
ncbi:PAS domain-containing sensor histidine kinase [Croceitalea rosinachiae]|uniref:histidine kinase n=1 Tax=Croceitalea rosinachiae TaxID=3075596 RepID=A0ABU3A831_9FLAO|nr:PAS domain-containing protein [Croceitalea sp. F388]MDT0606337.1 PAS domain-containing protein [Croceitalea sp. F388]